MKMNPLFIIIIIILIALPVFMLYNNSNLNISTQSVVGIDCPEVKSNVEDWGDYYNSNVWVAVDCNEDGVYEAYGYYSYSGGAYLPHSGETPEGYSYYCHLYNGDYQVWITDTSRSGCMNYAKCYSKFTTTMPIAENADLTCGTSIPTTICGNGVCEEGETIGTCYVDCYVPPNNEYKFSCVDTNSNSRIDRDEMGDIIMEWVK